MEIYKWLDSCSHHYINLLSISISFFPQWPKCTALLFLFFLIQYIWNSDKIQYLLFPPAGIWEISRLPLPSDSRVHGDSKISKLPDKIWRSRRKHVFGLHQERKPRHSGTGILFFRWEPRKISENPAIFFPGHKSPVRSWGPNFIGYGIIARPLNFMFLCFTSACCKLIHIMHTHWTKHTQNRNVYYIEILFSPLPSTLHLSAPWGILTDRDKPAPWLLRSARGHQSLGGVKGTGLGREFSWDVVSKKAGVDS